jgi:opacity protein-like surface antigen
MKRLIKFSLTPLALALSFPAIAERNWSGAYFGATVNEGITTSNSENTYSNNGASPPVGWAQNQFKGNLLNSIDSMRFTRSFLPTVQNTISTTSWAPNGSQSQSVTSGTLLAGSNIQVDNIVLGAEVRVSFGNFGATSNQSAGGSGNKYMSDYEGPVLTFTNYNSSISGITSPISGGYSYPSGLTNSVNYTLTGSQQSSVKYSNLSQAIGRAGYSFGDILGYVKGGLAYANVKASTSASINESATGTINNSGSITNYTGAQSYNFSGQSTKNMYGYAVGAGAEWALQENLSFRLEAEYYNLGKINVQGISSQTAATYSVSQQISAYNFSVGLVRKF